MGVENGQYAGGPPPQPQVQAPDYVKGGGYQQPPQHPQPAYTQQQYVEYDNSAYVSAHPVVVEEPEFNISPQRAAFLRRVVLIVAAQLIFAAGVCALFYFPEPVREWMVRYSWTTILLAFLFEIASLIFLVVVRKKPGVNIIAIALFTFATAYVLATILVYYDIMEIFEGVLITAIIVAACVLYVLITGPNFVFFGMVVVALSFMLLMWSLWFLITGLWLTYQGWVWYNQIFCLIAIMLFTAYLLFRISIVMTRFPTDEHVLAAIDIYLHIITIFMYVLMFLGGSRR